MSFLAGKEATFLKDWQRKAEVARVTAGVRGGVRRLPGTVLQKTL